jgi:hypothetical protein
MMERVCQGLDLVRLVDLWIFGALDGVQWSPMELGAAANT